MKAIVVCSIALFAAGCGRVNHGLPEIDTWKNGKWEPISVQIGLNKLPDDQLKDFSLTMDGDRYVMITNGVVDKGTFKMDGSVPRSMDMICTDGPNKGKTVFAIFGYSDATLMICFALEGPRPTVFSVTGDKMMLASYRRTK